MQAAGTGIHWKSLRHLASWGKYYFAASENRHGRVLSEGVKSSRPTTLPDAGKERVQQKSLESIPSTRVSQIYLQPSPSFFFPPCVCVFLE